MNTLTEAGVLAQDKLFATLDPTSRALVLPDAGGSCSSTPSDLSAVCRITRRGVNATLEEQSAPR